MRALALLKPDAEVTRAVAGGVAGDAGACGLADAGAGADFLDIGEDFARDGDLFGYGDIKHIDYLRLRA